MKGSRAVEKPEAKKMMDSMNIRDRVLVLTGLTFGTRISESLARKFKDFAAEYLHFASKKHSANQGFPIPESYRQALQELKAYYEAQGIKVTGDTYLFLSRKGENQPITRIQASRIIKDACETTGITGRVSTHSFRKAFVTEIYGLTGKDVVATMTYSRHRNLSNLVYYIKTTEKTDLINNLSWA